MSNPNALTQMYYVRQSDGLAYCFSPVPLIAETQQRLKTIIDDREAQLAIINTVTFNGVLLPDIPALSGVSNDASCLELLDRKSDQLRAALDEDRGNLLIVDGSGYPVLSVYPKIVSIDFEESQMVNRRNYSLVFEYESDITDGQRISEYTETWDFSYQEDDTISVSHSVSAVGIPSVPAGTGALANAKSFVLQRANTLNKDKSSFLTTPYMLSYVDIDNLNEYNHVRSESLDEAGGSYQISETWLLASGAYKDDRTIDYSYELDENGSLVETISINGTVQGYGDTTALRYANAASGFLNEVSVEIGFTATTGIASKSRSDNRFAGTVNYNMSYRPDTSGNALEDRTIQRSLQRNEDGTVSQTVTTTARVRLDSASGIDSAREYCFANNYPISFTTEPYFDASLSGNIESVSVELDALQKSCSLTRVYRDQGVSLYREEWEVSRDQNLESATTSISINGTVYGLGAESGTNTLVRFSNASGAFYNTIEPLLRTRAEELIPSGSCITDEPVSNTIGWNKLNGIVTYTYSWDNRFLTTNANVLDEKIDVTYDLPGDVIAIIPIPGKSTGPILQDQETVTEYRKNLRIQYTMRPSGSALCGMSTSTQSLLETEALRESNILVNNTPSDNARGEKPEASGVYKVSDQYTFNRQTLVFTRNTSWTYTAS